MGLYDPYAGTSIGADGLRYANDDEDIPTEAPPSKGKFVTQGALQALKDRVEDLDAFGERSVTDGVTVLDDATVTSATAVFLVGVDIGAGIAGDGIPEGATIVTRNSATSVEISEPATASATGVELTITRDLGAVVGDLRTRVAALEA